MARFTSGTSCEYIQADIWVRFQRMQGNVVHFVCADDAHGAPIMLKRKLRDYAAGAVARILPGGRDISNGFHIGFDHWYSTDSPRTRRCPGYLSRPERGRPDLRKPVEQFYDP